MLRAHWLTSIYRAIMINLKLLTLLALKQTLLLIQTNFLLILETKTEITLHVQEQLITYTPQRMTLRIKRLFAQNAE